MCNGCPIDDCETFWLETQSGADVVAVRLDNYIFAIVLKLSSSNGLVKSQEGSFVVFRGSCFLLYRLKGCAMSVFILNIFIQISWDWCKREPVFFRNSSHTMGHSPLPQLTMDKQAQLGLAAKTCSTTSLIHPIIYFIWPGRLYFQLHFWGQFKKVLPPY